MVGLSTALSPIMPIITSIYLNPRLVDNGPGPSTAPSHLDTLGSAIVTLRTLTARHIKETAL